MSQTVTEIQIRLFIHLYKKTATKQTHLFEGLNENEQRQWALNENNKTNKITHI